MFCPRCGHDGSNEQRFCRSCGFELTHVGELLQEAGQESLAANTTDKDQVKQRKLQRVGSIAVLSTISMAMLAFLAGIVVLMVTDKMPILAGVAILTFLIGLSVGFICLGMAALPRLSKLSKATQALKDNSSTSALVGPPVEQALPSVTEHTTELLTDRRP